MIPFRCPTLASVGHLSLLFHKLSYLPIGIGTIYLHKINIALLQQLTWLHTGDALESSAEVGDAAIAKHIGYVCNGAALPLQ